MLEATLANSQTQMQISPQLFLYSFWDVFCPSSFLARALQPWSQHLPLDFSVYLWGNTPAYGILGLPPLTTCHSLPHVISICFAASGDLRNVVETVCQIPHSFSSRINIYINDYNPHVALRNLVMLELLRAHGTNAIDAVIALWYSIAMTEMQHKAVTNVVRNILLSSSGGTGYCAEFMGSSGKSLLEMDVG